MKKKKILVCIFVLVAIFSLVATPVVTIQPLVVNEQEISPQLEPTDRLSPGVSNLLSEGSNPVSIIVQTSTHDYSQISTLVQSLGGKITNEYKNIDALALTIPADKLIDLAASPLVLKIYQETMYNLMTSTDLNIPEDILMTQVPGIEYEPIDLEAMDVIPSTYVNPTLTKADQIWDQTGFGSGVKVAIIDTGSWSEPWVIGGETHYPWYWDSVYDGVDLSSDVGTPYEGYGNPMNHYHGTACAALLAARVDITFGLGHPWAESMLYHYPGHPWAESMLYHYPDAGYYDDGTFIVTQSEETYIIDLIEGTQSAVDFYDYYSSSGHTPFMKDLVSKIYLYNDITSGELSLIMHHSKDDSTSSYMRVDFNLEGVPEGAYVALSDDSTHKWNKTRNPKGLEFDITQEPEGNWEHYRNSDGGVLGGLPTDEAWSITISPTFIAGLNSWQYHTLGDIDIDLLMDKPVTISYIPPSPHIIALGIAPLASIYAVKIFSHTGAGVPSSKVMEGIDAAIEEGVDVISMSLGGGVGAPGIDPTDLLVDAATAAGISVVVAAGNEGPAPLRVGSPGTAKTAITVGAAMDPIHERVFGGIVLPHPSFGNYYYPSNELGIADFSSRGPTSDGRIKPDVVATGSWVFYGLTPQDWPYTIGLGVGTSFSCPQVAGEAALLTAYIKDHDLDLGPKEIKEAIMLGAEPIDGFTEIEQGAGYINCDNSLAILKEMEPDPHGHCHHRRGHRKWGYPHWNCKWYPPIDTIGLKRGKTTIEDVTLEPGKYEYFAFWVRQQVDAIRITLSGVEFGSQNPFFGDAGVLYLSNAPRDGVEDYMIYGQYFWDVDSKTPDEFVFQYSKDVIFQPGLVRLALAGDFSSFDTITIDEITIEVVEVDAWRWRNWMVITSSGVDVDEAQVVIFDGTIETHKGKVKEGEIDFYTFTMPNDYGIAFVELSWKRDWTRWATSDLDLIIYGPYGINAEGATGASPEAAMILGEGRYVLLVEGYQVYWNRNEKYILRITYLANPEPLWESDIITLDSWFQVIRLPKKIRGVAVVLIHDPNYLYAADFVKV
jgi:subtilisin family serine protease